MRLYGVFLLTVMLTSTARGQISIDILQKIFQISATANHEKTGTAFLADVKSQVALVTAKHVFESVNFPKTATIYLNSATGWKAEFVTITYSPVYDLAVIQDASLSSRSGLTICSGTHNTSELLSFFGYPFQFHSDSVTPELSDFIIPYVKHAYIAGTAKMGFKEHPLLVLDALNNYGFSGGPVTAIEASGGCVYGVTISFYPGDENVVDKQRKETGTTVPYNSGLMYAVPASGIAELFSQIATH